jgi:hypothetical protein
MDRQKIVLMLNWPSIKSLQSSHTIFVHTRVDFFTETTSNTARFFPTNEQEAELLVACQTDGTAKLQ